MASAPTGIFIKQPQKCVGSKCSMNLYFQIWGKGHSYTHKRSTCVLELVKHLEWSKSPSHGRVERFGPFPMIYICYSVAILLALWNIRHIDQACRWHWNQFRLRIWNKGVLKLKQLQLGSFYHFLKTSSIASALIWKWQKGVSKKKSWRAIFRLAPRECGIVPITILEIHNTFLFK